MEQLMVRRRARAMRTFNAPLCTPLVRDAFSCLMHEPAKRHGAKEYGMDCISPEQGYAADGIIIWARMPDGLRERVVFDDQTARALDAGLEWRYRLVAGPRVWSVRPLWMRRDGDACKRLMLDAIADVFTDSPANPR